MIPHGSKRGNPAHSRRSISVHLAFTMALSFLACSPSGRAAWQTELADGRAISVDPATQRAEVTSGEAAGRPLWDGVHRLSDGSTITIRSGVLVPNKQSLSRPPVTPHAGPDEPPALTSRARKINACDRLLLYTCGLHKECLDRQSCQLSHQLMALQRRAHRVDPAENRWVIGQCEQALGNQQNFQRCEHADPVVNFPCHYLVARVCSRKKRCSASPTCRLAHQLLSLQRHRISAGSPPDPGARNQCEQMLLEHAGFPPCR